MSNHTAQELRTIADAVDAKAAGKSVEQMHPRYTKGQWQPMLHGEILIIGDWRYRPAPTPEVIPWTRETLPPLPVEVVMASSKNRYIIVAAHEEYVSMGGYGSFGYSELLERCTRPGNSPCGEVKA